MVAIICASRVSDDSLNCFTKINKMGSKMGFEMSLIIGEAIPLYVDDVRVS